MDADERRCVGRLAKHEGQVLTAVGERAVNAELEFTPSGVKGAFGDEFDQAFPAVAEFDELRDGDHAEPEALLEFNEFRQACHRAILIEDFADNPAWV